MLTPRPIDILFPYTTLFRSALKDCAVAIRIRRLQGDPIRLARTLNNAGLALHHLGELRDAEARFQEAGFRVRSEEHTSELQSPCKIVCRLLLEKKNRTNSNK